MHIVSFLTTYTSKSSFNRTSFSSECFCKSNFGKVASHSHNAQAIAKVPFHESLNFKCIRQKEVFGKVAYHGHNAQAIVKVPLHESLNFKYKF